MTVRVVESVRIKSSFQISKVAYSNSLPALRVRIGSVASLLANTRGENRARLKTYQMVSLGLRRKDVFLVSSNEN